MLFKESIKRFTPPKGWGWASIGDVAKLSFSSVDKKSVEGEKAVRLCNYMDVFYNRRIREGMPFMASTASDSDIKKFTLNKDDVVLTKDSETPEEIAFAAVIDEQIDNLVCGYHLAVLRPDQGKVTGEYLMSAINFHPNHHQFVRLANGATRFGLGIDSLNNALIPLPPLAEQRKIAKILRTWDEAIETAEAELKAKQERKRWLYGTLLKSKAIQTCQLRDLVDRLTAPSKNPSMHEVLSISSGKGFESQKAKYSKVIAGKQVEKYVLIRRGDFSYNKGNSIRYPVGCVYQLKEFDNGIVPNVFCSFRIKLGKVSASYLGHYFEAGLHNKSLAKLVNLGVRNNGLLNITPEEFFGISLSLPSIETQSKSAEILDDADMDIMQAKYLVSLLKNQKLGLMQKLLTGEVRVAA